MLLEKQKIKLTLDEKSNQFATRHLDNRNMRTGYVKFIQFLFK